MWQDHPPRPHRDVYKRQGLRHALIRDKVTVLIGREPLYGGSLSDEEARELMEGRYQIVSGLPAPEMCIRDRCRAR